jgi:hypothetical protein
MKKSRGRLRAVPRRGSTPARGTDRELPSPFPYLKLSGTADDRMQNLYAYSHADEWLKDELVAHFAALKRNGLVDVWHESRIPAGGILHDEIDANLQSSHLFLFLISTDFIDSDYCFHKEYQEAVKRRQAGEAEIVPIIKHPVQPVQPESVIARLIAAHRPQATCALTSELGLQAADKFEQPLRVPARYRMHADLVAQPRCERRHEPGRAPNQRRYWSTPTCCIGSVVNGAASASPPWRASIPDAFFGSGLPAAVSKGLRPSRAEGARALARQRPGPPPSSALRLCRRACGGLKQALELGGYVRKGEAGDVVYYRRAPGGTLPGHPSKQFGLSH